MREGVGSPGQSVCVERGWGASELLKEAAVLGPSGEATASSGADGAFPCLGRKWHGRLLPAAQLPTLYDFHFDPAQKKWIPWSKLVPEYVHSRERKFIEILGE